MTTAQSEATGAAAPSGARLLALLLGVLVVGGYLAHAWIYVEQINDDAYVSFRYAQNLAEGRGPYFNTGEPLEGYNNFLFMLQMSAAIAIFGPDEAPFVAKLLGIDGGVGAILAAWLLASLWLCSVPVLRPHAFALGWIAGGLVAVNAAFAMQSMTGLGTVQYAALLALGLVLLQGAWMRDRWYGAGVLFALALLSRPESVLILAAIWLARWRVGEFRFAGRGLLLDSAIVGGTFVAYLAFRFLAYDGQLISSAFYARLGGIDGRIEIGYLADFIRRHLGGIFAIFGLLPLLAGTHRQRRNVLPATLALAAGALALIFSGSDGEVGYRFLVPYAPIWAAAATFGVGLTGTRIKPMPRLGTFAVGILLMAAIWLTQLPTAQYYDGYVTLRANGFQRGHRALAAWLQQVAEPGDSVAVLDPGVIGFNCMDLRVRDLSGVHDPEIGPRAEPLVLHPAGVSEATRALAARVLADRPAFLVIVNVAPWEQAGVNPGMQMDPAKVRRLTTLEEAIVHTPLFAAHYDRPRPAPRTANTLEAMTALLGAEAIFMHDYPGRFYMLTVYRYHE